MSNATFKLNPAAARRVIDAGRSGLKDAGESLLESANRTAPIEEGTLIRSGSVTTSTDGSEVSVSYDTPYARRQHEDTRLRHDDGRRAKWLERTLNERHTTLTAYIARKMREAF